MKNKFLTLAFAFLATLSFAQESVDSTKCKNWDLTFGADVASRYLWRGQQLSGSPCVQPSMVLSYKNLSLSSWSSYTFSKESLQEFDLALSYEIKNLTVAVTDYFVPDETVINNRYFIYDKENTGHVIETSISWTGEKIPLSITAGSFVYGDDKEYGYDTNKDSLSENYFSTYGEIAYNTKLKDNDVSVFLGFTPTSGYYGNTMGVINCGFTASKEIKITDSFSIPMTATIMFNPQTQNSWFGLVMSF